MTLFHWAMPGEVGQRQEKNCLGSLLVGWECWGFAACRTSSLGVSAGQQNRRKLLLPKQKRSPTTIWRQKQRSWGVFSSQESFCSLGCTSPLPNEAALSLRPNGPALCLSPNGQRREGVLCWENWGLHRSEFMKKARFLLILTTEYDSVGKESGREKSKECWKKTCGDKTAQAAQAG